MPGLAGQIPNYRGVKIVTGADKILDWLRHDSKAFPVFKWAERAERNLDPGCVVPADVGVEDFNEVINGRSPPVTRIKQFGLEPGQDSVQINRPVHLIV
jgi:hypothetical protein